jgi:hypothetical protein
MPLISIQTCIYYPFVTNICTTSGILVLEIATGLCVSLLVSAGALGNVVLRARNGGESGEINVVEVFVIRVCIVRVFAGHCALE